MHPITQGQRQIPTLKNTHKCFFSHGFASMLSDIRKINSYFLITAKTYTMVNYILLTFHHIYFKFTLAIHKITQHSILPGSHIDFDQRLLELRQFKRRMN